uniref:Secreted protein n=1 Tax=Anopheles dirus TaxID=7168 RepID=A0A182NW09_9DIPT
MLVMVVVVVVVVGDGAGTLLPVTDAATAEELDVVVVVAAVACCCWCVVGAVAVGFGAAATVSGCFCSSTFVLCVATTTYCWTCRPGAAVTTADTALDALTSGVMIGDRTVVATDGTAADDTVGGTSTEALVLPGALDGGVVPPGTIAADCCCRLPPPAAAKMSCWCWGAPLPLLPPGGYIGYCGLGLLRVEPPPPPPPPPPGSMWGELVIAVPMLPPTLPLLPPTTEAPLA